MSMLGGYSQRYELRGLIGRGGLGEVLLAMDMHLNRLVAIKRLHSSDTEGEDLATAAIREARTLASLMHPNIVTIFDIFQYNRDVLVAMEYVRGKTLQEIGDYAPMGSASFLPIADQSLLALSAAHEQGILHRDVKPGNIMVASNKTKAISVKVLDFGLATLAESVQAVTYEQEKEILGSIYTMAPEQFEQLGEDERTDIYSLGCVLYFILAGTYPFTGGSVNDVINAHLDHVVTPLHDVRSDLDPGLCDWVMRLFEVAPDSRPASAADAHAGLSDLRAGLKL